MIRKTLLVSALAACAAALDISISDTTTHPISPTLYGYMWEDINHSGDGGLYGELLQNRAFQIVTPGTAAALYAWEAVKGVSLAVVNNTAPVSSALPNSLEVSIARGMTGTVSFANTGYWGMKVTGNATYTGSFYVKSSSYAGPVSVSLQGAQSKTVYARTTPVAKVSGTYTKHTFTLTPRMSAPDANNTFVVELAAAGAASTTHFGLFTLFPPTFKGRANGMRQDLAETLAATSPKIWRFPGGNNLEGQSIDTRWKWNETIGPLEMRPGRMGDWGYVNDDGLGLMEYMNWAEDIGAEVILGVWAGYALAGTPQNVPQDQLQPYITDVINEIHFLTDANTTSWGALRAKYGRSAPYPLKYVEIGNEDFFSNVTYANYRWPMYVTQLKAEFPHLNYLDTAYASTNLSPAASYIDYHNYDSPSWFANNTQMFDTYNRSLQYFVGEYAVISTNQSNLYGTPAEGRFVYPEMRGSVAEAAFMTGMERNSDVVFASAYAPSLQHINGTQWTPDLVTFDAHKLVRSTSYYVQQLFATHLGTHVLSTTPAAGAAPVWWVASVNRTSGAVFLKVANTGAASVPVALALGFAVASPAHVTTLAGPGTTSNTLEAPDTIVPVNSTVAVAGGTRIAHTLPPYAVAVFEMARAAGPAGCVAAHWDQCGGIGFTGCTTCASGTTCKLSPDSNGYYAQCL